jgi:hypothetical protein
MMRIRKITQKRRRWRYIKKMRRTLTEIIIIVVVVTLFNDAVSILDYIASNSKMIGEYLIERT